jgi:hypothetical protein
MGNRSGQRIVSIWSEIALSKEAASIPQKSRERPPLTFKDRQRVNGSCDGAPKYSSLQEPTSLKGRKAASRRRNGLAPAVPPGSESRTRSRGFPRNLGGPVVSAANPGGRYRVTNSRPVVGALDGRGSETRVQPWYRQAKATKRGGRGGGESERLIVLLTRGNRPEGPRRGKGAPGHETVGGKDGGTPSPGTISTRR